MTASRVSDRDVPAGGSARSRRDAAEFEDASAFCRSVAASAFFAAGAPVAVSRAPARLDVLGGIADYSGALVLESPLRVGVLVAAQRDPSGRVIAVSGDRRIDVDAADLVDASLERLADRFSGWDAWAAYVLGPVALLAREERCPLHGLRLLVSSKIPEGKGLGSSAAVEIAALQAAAAALAVDVEPRRLVLLAQRAEQVFARAPCGAMDQSAVMHGEEGHLLALLCRPAEVVSSAPLPDGLALWGVDSGLRHAVSGDAYRRVRCAAFMGKALLGWDDGYLAELDLARVDAEALPETLLGADFLGLRDGIDDPFSAVEPAVAYPVRAATLFPLEEHARVRRFLDLIGHPPTEESSRVLGELMYESHAGYSRCGLGLSRTDAIVEAVRRAGLLSGLIGARVSGGGSGGTVAVLGRPDAEPVVRRIAEKLGSGLVGGSSPGAARFGVRIVTPEGPQRRGPSMAVTRRVPPSP